MAETLPMRRVTDHPTFRRRLRVWLVSFVGLLILAGILSWMVVHEDRARERERVEARLVFCQEIERVKAALRHDLEEQIREDEQFLAGAAGLPLGPLEEQIRRSLARDRRTLATLRPYRGGCEAFAANPLNSKES